VSAGDTVVIRYVGPPPAGQALPEMLQVTSAIVGRGLGESVAFDPLTDDSAVATPAGLMVGHVAPEAAAGGAIGLLRDGDQNRLWTPRRGPYPSRGSTSRSAAGEAPVARSGPTHEFTSWRFSPRYASTVGSAAEGAIYESSSCDEKETHYESRTPPQCCFFLFPSV